MPLSNTPLNNPLNVSERELVGEELEALIENLLDDPTHPESDLPLDEQTRLILESVRHLQHTAAVLMGDDIGFNEAAHVSNILEMMMAEIDDDEEDRERRRTLLGVSAKLDAACESVLPARRDEYLRRTHEEVRARGFSIQHVLAEGEPAAIPTFSYTTGLNARGSAEFVVVGLAHAQAHFILETLAAHALAGRAYEEGEHVLGVLENGFALALTTCPTPLLANLHTAFTDGTPPTAWQVLWPDKNGALPHEDTVEDEVRTAQDFPHYAQLDF
jgi:hypothetical protein